MTGTPVKTLRPIFARLLNETGQDALDWFCEEVATGDKMHVIAKRLSDWSLNPKGVTRDSIRRYLDFTYGEDVVEDRIDKAKRQGTHNLVEDAEHVVEAANPAPETGEVAKAKELARLMRQRAAFNNPTRYGEQKAQVNVNVSLAGLHLSALRARAVPDPVPLAPSVDAEVLSIDPGASDDSASPMLSPPPDE